jgi:hypothetical protein
VRSSGIRSARPGGNATGINFFGQEVTAKRMGVLNQLVPKAVRVAVLVNPANATTAEATLREIPEAARALGLQIRVLNASTSREIEAAFATLGREPADALFVAGDGFFTSRRVQFAVLAVRHAIPAIYSTREYPEVGGLMSYGTDVVDRFRQVGVMSGQILKGAKPADLPVIQSTKFELVINLQTARALGLELQIPPGGEPGGMPEMAAGGPGGRQPKRGRRSPVPNTETRPASPLIAHARGSGVCNPQTPLQADPLRSSLVVLDRPTPASEWRGAPESSR